MKLMIMFVSLIVATQEANAQPSELDRAMAACERHREAPVPKIRQKIWHQGWEKCSTIQDLWDASESARKAKQKLDEEHATKELIDRLTK